MAEMRPYTEFHIILEAIEGMENRCDVMSPTALNNTTCSSIQLPLEFISEILGSSCEQGVIVIQF